MMFFFVDRQGFILVNKKYHIMAKLSALMCGFMFLIVVLIGFNILQSRNVMIQERQMLIRSVVESASSLVGFYHERVLKGEFSVEEAQERARRAVRSIRYGQDGYLFIFNTDGVIEAHALYNELEGKQSRVDLRDANGVPYVRNQIDMALSGGGYTYYHYKKPGMGGAAFPKMVYDKLFAPWNWVIATGVYIDDIEKTVHDEIATWTKVVIPPFILFAMLAFYFGKMITRPIDQLEKAKITAEAATRAKSDFLANMSHEIRTPLNGSMGMLALLLGTKMSLQQREWAQIAYQSSEELLNLINDILDISKVEAGQMTLENLPFDLQTNIKAVTDLLYPRAHRKGVEILVSFQSDLPRMVVGDPVRLRQILMNLVGNAVKFTSHGYIMISVEGQLKEDRYHLKFEVRDTGTGIPEDKQSYIFEKFSQAEESTTRNFGGTGLGLAICRKLTALMGGAVGVRSVLGQGSTFWFTVVLDKSEVSESVVPSAVEAALTRIMVTEPHETVAQMIYGYLQHWGYRAERVLTESNALALLQQAVVLEDPFGYLLIDVGAWGEEPNALTDKIDMFLCLASETFLILIAAPDKPLPLDEIRLKKSVGVLTKPIFPQDLYDVLRMLATQDTPEPRFVMAREDQLGWKIHDVQKRSDQDATNRVRQILIAEDQRVNQMLMSTLMKQFGCESDIAVNGIEAVRRAAEKQYDLIFMDGHMPEMDGLEATKQIRAFEENLGRHTPIIALTADAMKGDRDKCIDAGMDDYLHKPVKVESIKAMIEKYTGPVQSFHFEDLS